MKIMLSKQFDWFLILCIIVNAINIASSDYSYRLTSSEEKVQGLSSYIGTVITYIFILEFLIKIIAQGFISGKNNYLASGWNKLDFIVVLTGVYH